MTTHLTTQIETDVLLRRWEEETGHSDEQDLTVSQCWHLHAHLAEAIEETGVDVAMPPRERTDIREWIDGNRQDITDVLRRLDADNGVTSIRPSPRYYEG